MIAGKTCDKLQPWEPKQDKNALTFRFFLGERIVMMKMKRKKNNNR